MALSFFETMQGEVTDPEGGVHALEFSVKAEASHLREFARDGVARLRGVVNVEPWARDAVLEGTITIRPFRGRFIAYDVHFLDEDERPCRFKGQKEVRWLWRALASLTYLEGELTREGAHLARGWMRFDLRDLLPFLSSWSLRSSFQHRDLEQASIGAEGPLSPLSAAQSDTLRAAAEVCIVAGEHIPPVDEETARGAAAFMGGLPHSARLGVRLALGSLDAFSRLRYGRRFSSLSFSRRQGIVEGSAVLGPPQALLEAVAAPIKAAHFGREDYLSAVGAPSFVHEVREPKPSYLQQVTPPEALESHTLEAEVVVIGTGAGGAAIAARLAEEGRAVALLEAGRYYHREDFSGSPVRRSQRFWSQRGMTFGVGNCLTSIPLGKLVGGTTTINSGTCYRTPDAVLQEWRGLGFPADFEPEAFARWLDPVMEELQVAPADRRYLGRIADVVGRGADALQLEHGPLPRNAPGCDGQGTCIFGCPTDAKRSANVSWVPRALRAGAELFTGLRARRLLMRNGRVVGVFASGTDDSGVARELTIKAEAVVVACGTIASPVLLGDNDIRLPALGRNLSVHPGFGMYVLNEEDGAPWSAIPQGYGVKGHGLRGVMFEGFYLPPQHAALALPAIGSELTRWLDRPGRVDQFGFMVRDDNNGRVRRLPTGGFVIHKSLSTRTVHRLQRGSALLAELLLRGGGEAVYTCVGDVGAVHSVAEARAINGLRLRAQDFRILGAHPLATCRMGASPDDSVVDFEHRVHGTENLYVVDGASVPSSLGVNPQVTIMAMALRAGDLLDERLS
jgi:choline dehydrogenase-like flavoprotein